MNFMPALSNICFLPSRPIPVASTSTSLVSEPLAPAFMRSAPPMVPGMPKKNSSPPILAPPAASPDHDARHATVAHDQIGANADDADRNLIRQMLKEIGEVIFIRWREQQLRRTADPKPRQLGQRLVRQQPSAQLRHRGFEIGRDVGEGHAYLLQQLIS